jgi:transcriptional regulator with XRE-family HTH domain
VQILSVSQQVLEAAQSKGLKQAELGRMTGYSNKSISAFKTGGRRIPRQARDTIVHRIGDPWLYMEAVREDSMVFTTPKLNGENVDLHRCSVINKCLEELREAEETIKQLEPTIINLPRKSDPQTTATVKAGLLQIADVEVAVNHTIAALCDAFEISVEEVFESHLQKLIDRGYVKKEKPPLQRRR